MLDTLRQIWQHYPGLASRSVAGERHQPQHALPGNLLRRRRGSAGQAANAAATAQSRSGHALSRAQTRPQAAARQWLAPLAATMRDEHFSPTRRRKVAALISRSILSAPDAGSGCATAGRARCIANHLPGTSIAWHASLLLPHIPAEGVPYQAFYEARLGRSRHRSAPRAQVRAAAEAAGLSLNHAAIQVFPNTQRWCAPW